VETPELRLLDLGQADPVADRLWQAWSQPASSLRERVARTRRAGLSLGMWNLEGPARALLLDPALGSPAQRAEAAALLAPDLPAARAARARSRMDRGELLPGLAELLAALRAVPEHLEARLWAEATLLEAAVGVCWLGGLLFLAVAALLGLPRLVRELARLHETLPQASRLAMVACLLLLPAALGQGLLGAALALAALASSSGGWSRQAAVALSLALLVLGLHPVLDRAAAARVALAADPVALAAWSAENGLPDAAERARLRRRADRDPLAARAVALRDKRAGRLDAADARFRSLLAPDSPPELLNNAANVLLARGELADAIALYQEAAARASSPIVLFNLSQAYGRAVRLDEQDQALAEAQSVDPTRISELTAGLGAISAAVVVDAPLPASRVLARLRDPQAAEQLAAGLRLWLSPGASGRSALAAALAALAALCLGGLLRWWLGPEDPDDLYAGIARVLQEETDSAGRMRQLSAIRSRQAREERLAVALSLALPGAAGLLARRPLLGLLSALAFAAGGALVWLRHGVLPDPLALGCLPALLVPAALGAAALLYTGTTGMALWLRERP